MQPSKSQSGQVTDDVLRSLMEQSRDAVAHERQYHKYFGPRFQGDYSSVGGVDLVFAYLQMTALEVQNQFDTVKSDFSKLHSLLSQAPNRAKARKVLEVATHAYRATEARTASQISFIQKIAAMHGEDAFFDAVEEHCRLNWSLSMQLFVQWAAADAAEAVSKEADGAESEASDGGDGDEGGCRPAEDDREPCSAEPECTDSAPGGDGPE